MTVWLLDASQDLAVAAPMFVSRSLLLGAATEARADWRARDVRTTTERLSAARRAVAELVGLLGDLEHVAFIGRRLSEEPGPRSKATGSPDLSNKGDPRIRAFISNVEREIRHLTSICEALARRVSIRHVTATPKVVLRTAKAIDTATDSWLAGAHALLDGGPGPDTSLRGSLLGAYGLNDRGRRTVVESAGAELSRLTDAQRRRRAGVNRDLGEWEPVPSDALLRSLRRPLCPAKPFGGVAMYKDYQRGAVEAQGGL